jgi:hypothetical protein
LPCGPAILLCASLSLSTDELRQRLSHVRWIGGGTGAGKSTVAAILAGRFDLDVYDGDQGERGYLARVRPDSQPRMTAWLAMTLEQRWLDRPPSQIIAAMPSMHGETFPFVLDDLLVRPGGKVLLVDDFRTLPSAVAPLLSWPGQAVFLLPAPLFREQALRSRYTDPARARANWSDADPLPFIAARLARDDLWDAEVRRQAGEADLTVLRIDGRRSPDDVADEIARQFRLTPAPE